MPEGVPARTVWPRSLVDPATWECVDEFGTAVRAVHEAAHAVVAAALGLTVVRVWVGDDHDREAGDPITATGITEVEGQHGKAGVIVALAAWPATLRHLRLLGLDNDGNLAGFNAAAVHDRTTALLIHAADHGDCPDIAAGAWGRCDQMTRLADTAAGMTHRHWDQIMIVAGRLADADGRLDYPQIPLTPNHT